MGAGQFEDYNTIHPHSGLRMRSPREFIEQQSVNQAACPVDGGHPSDICFLRHIVCK